jgi:hypothetical protein
MLKLTIAFALIVMALPALAQAPDVVAITPTLFQAVTKYLTMGGTRQEGDLLAVYMQDAANAPAKNKQLADSLNTAKELEATKAKLKDLEDKQKSP